VLKNMPIASTAMVSADRVESPCLGAFSGQQP
jgi:hypothetical protein